MWETGAGISFGQKNKMSREVLLKLAGRRIYSAFPDLRVIRFIFGNFVSDGERHNINFAAKFLTKF